MSSIPADSIVHVTASRGPARASLIADFEKVNSCVLQGGSNTHSSVSSRRCDPEREETKSSPCFGEKKNHI